MIVRHTADKRLSESSLPTAKNLGDLEVSKDLSLSTAA